MEVSKLVLTRSHEAARLAEYQATRDRLSRGLFATTDAIASFDWTSTGSACSSDS